MYQVESYLRVRRAVMVEGMSIREASRAFGLHQDTVRKMLAYSIPPGYRRQTTLRHPKLEPFTGVIAGPKRCSCPCLIRRATPSAISARPWWSSVACSRRPPASSWTCPTATAASSRPTRRRPPRHSWTPTSQHSPFLGGVLRSILYDNTRLAVARILGDGRRKRTKSFTELQSHYLFEDRFGGPGKGNDKGKVEGLVGYVRRNFLVPIPSVNKQLVMELVRCEFVDHRENVIAVGNSGTGKTHVALGLGLAACQRGMSVGFTTAAGLVHEMMEARDERRLLNLQRHMSRLKLLIIDELGFVPLSRTGAELLFEVFSQRCERGSILVTTNLPFDEWTEVFGSERLTGALLDRLTHHVHILEMNGESYRLKRSRENASPQASEEPDEE